MYLPLLWNWFNSFS